MSLNAATIIDALGGANGLARCPAHDDKTPSLSISEKHGRILFHCHAGCSQEAVLAALKARGLWPSKTQEQSLKLEPTIDNDEVANDFKRFKRAFAILRAAGYADAVKPTAYLRGRGIETAPPGAMMLPAKLSRKHIRTAFPAMVLPVIGSTGLKGAHVTFLARDGKTKLNSAKPKKMYGPVKGGYAVVRTLDRHRPLIIGEGVESTASAAQITGLPAIATLSASHMPHITPPPCKEIIIAADNDDAGINAAKALARKLAVRHVVRIAIPERGDWNDEIRRADDPADLREAILNADRFEEVPVARALTMDEVIEMAIAPREHLLGPWLETGSLAMAHAQRGDGKTLLMMSVAYAVASGKPMLDWRCERPARTLYVDGELPTSVLQQRLKMLGPATPKQRAGIVDAMNSKQLFAPYFVGASWNGWRIVLRAAFGLPMTEPERTFFRTVAGRDPPIKRVRELWIVAGRRAGKDSIASLIVAYTAALFSGANRLRGGERALCVGLACDRDQAKIVLGYTRSYFADVPTLKAMVTRETANGFELTNGVEVAVGTNSFRSVRGRPILCAVLDECAFYRDEASANPDEETYRALRPGMATMAPDAMLIGISTPYRKSGLLYKKYHDHFGRDGDILVVKAPSILLNPTLEQAVIDEAMAEDPVAAAAEWNAEFRDDIAGWATRELIEAAVDRDVLARPPRQGVRYVSFVDASGGMRDSFTCGIAHNENGIAFLDCLIEIRAPFNPDTATDEIATLLKSYGCHSTTGDKYGAAWVVQAFRNCGIRYEHSERDRSAIYLDALPLFTTGRVRLIDNKRLVSQFATLERRTSPVGKDRVDHGPGGHDDVANAAAGSLVLAGAGTKADSWARWAKVDVGSTRLNGRLPQSAEVYANMRRNIWQL